MSLQVPESLQQAARNGEIGDDDFVAVVRDSLPYAYGLIEGLVEERSRTGADYSENLVPPPDEQARGQLLRALASDSIRASLERHFGVTLAFQNCHKVIVLPARPDPALRQRVTSPRAQVLNQTPELVDC